MQCNSISLLTLLLFLTYADTAKTSLSNQEAPEPSQGLQLDAIDSILRHQKEAEIDLLWKQLEALAKAVEGKSL